MIRLNRNNALPGISSISSAGISGTVIDIRIIMQFALNSNASAVVLAHNHPGGNLNPGRADVEIAKSIKAVLDVFDIRLPDHLIITPEREFTSIMERLQGIWRIPIAGCGGDLFYKLILGLVKLLANLYKQ